MKGLKKLALATAVAAAPFAANADLKALDDVSMGNVTGQAGVTIELETKVSIGQFKYTDEGSFAVNNIVLGGSGVAGGTGGDKLDELKIDIDVADDGDAIIHVGSLAEEDLINPVTKQPVYVNGTDDTDGIVQKPVAIDWGVTVGSVALLPGSTGSDSTTLLSNMSMHGDLAQLDIQVDTATDALWLDVAFDIDDMDFDVDFLGIGVRDMVITGAGTNFDYDGDGLTAEIEAGYAAGTETEKDAIVAGLVASELFADEAEAEAFLQANANGEGHNLGTADGMIGFGKLTQYAQASLDVYKGDGLGSSTMKDVLRIDVDNVYMDVSIGETIIGGTNIGTIAIDNLAVTDTKLAVYGR
ncbi:MULTISPECIES: DUF6160 family protein [unclassified Marinobacter]|uniref:DUF6160 family protein n=1 Tax=unclassified Marinobacter TaxID=83889 RepID=UPI0018F15267|nr:MULTISPECIES: DUF6160 family protein [unclassified Marinobacter]